MVYNSIMSFLTRIKNIVKTYWSKILNSCGLIFPALSGLCSISTVLFLLKAPTRIMEKARADNEIAIKIKTKFERSVKKN